MSVILATGFDNYDTIVDFWDTPGTDCVINSAGKARTGTRCLQIRSAAIGPRKGLPVHYTHLLMCVSWDSSDAGAVFQFMNMDTLENQVRATVQADGSILFGWGNANNLITQSAGGLVHFNSYNSVAVEVQNFASNNGVGANTGIITLWVNGVQIFRRTGLTTATGAGLGYCNGVQMMGPGGIPNHCYLDDLYLLNCAVAPNITFLGALRLYALPPTANAVVQWTPNAGANWSNVNEVPPNGDTSFNSSATIGEADQYVYPLVGPPTNSTLLFVAHELDMKIDSGARSVASDIEGNLGTAAALTNGYHIYQTPYDTNPVTGSQFVQGDFPLNAGPQVTA